MSAADASSLNWLSWLYTVGAWLVVIGVILEGAEIVARRLAQRRLRRFIGPQQHSLPEPETPYWAHIGGDFGFSILVVGLIVEQICHQGMEKITDRESRRLSAELRRAVESSGEAIKQAGAANERAALTEANNLVLRSNVVALELKLLPRTISTKQTNEFITLLKRYPKLPIKVFTPHADNEAYRYASRIRNMLNDAGYGTNGESVIEVTGYVREWNNAPFQFNEREIGCLYYGTNRTTTTIFPVPDIIMNPDGNPVLIRTNSFSAFHVVTWAFDRIQITTGTGEDSNLLNPGEVGIYVPTKTH